MANKLKPIFHALAPLLRGEKQRQAAVDQHGLATKPRSPELQAIVKEVSELFGSDIGVVTVIDRQKQLILANHGTQLDTVDRDISFCGHAIARPNEVMCVFDAAHDPRFAGNPLVLGSPNIRFYVGAPLLSAEGEALGALCAIDRQPRMKLLPEQTRRLHKLAKQASALLTAEKD